MFTYTLPLLTAISSCAFRAGLQANGRGLGPDLPLQDLGTTLTHSPAPQTSPCARRAIIH